MTKTLKHRLAGVMVAMAAATGCCLGQDIPDDMPLDSLRTNMEDIILFESSDAEDDSLKTTSLVITDTLPRRAKRDWSTWKPDPKRALWLSIVLPGAGQIYNRKFWKLPIVYGGFVGCIYAMQWNNQMYNDYSRAYLDIMDKDPNTQSYNQFLHLGTTITPLNEERFKTLFRKRKDYYRRYRDLSFFILIGVYALSVIDAYVDASLSDFNISKDLSMKVAPAIISTKNDPNIIRSGALGLQCSLNF